MGGAVFLNCDFYVCHEEDRQYFCKSVGPLSIVDCRYHSKKPVYAGWTHDPTGWLRCYQYNVKDVYKRQLPDWFLRTIH